MTTTNRLVLTVPLLVERPVSGSGCCVVPAEHVLQEDLERLDGVSGIGIDRPTGRVVVRYDPDRLRAERVLRTLAWTGYPATEPTGVGDPKSERT